MHEGLLSQLKKWSKDPDTEILVDVAGPFVHCFHSPELIAFTLFNKQMTHGPDEFFNLQEARDDSTLLSVASRIISEYRSIGRTEFWRPHLFDLLLAQILQCFRTGRFSQPSDAITLCELVGSCAHRLHEQYVSRLHRTGSRGQICLLNWGTSSNMICVKSNRVHYLYQGLWYRDWTLTHSSAVSERAFQRLKNLHLQEKNGQVETKENMRSFFSSLQSKILQTKRVIEKQL